MTDLFDHFHKALKSGNARLVVEVLIVILDNARDRHEPIYFNNVLVYQFKNNNYAFSFYDVNERLIFTFNLQQGCKFSRVNANTLGVQTIGKPMMPLQIGGKVVSDEKRQRMGNIADLKYSFTGERAAELKDAVDALIRHPSVPHDEALLKIAKELRRLIYPNG